MKKSFHEQTTNPLTPTPAQSLFPNRCLFIFLKDGTPIFFTHKRVGINYTFLQMYKFRSMKKNRHNIATDLFKNQQFLPYLKGKLESNITLFNTDAGMKKLFLFCP